MVRSSSNLDIIFCIFFFAFLSGTASWKAPRGFVIERVLKPIGINVPSLYLAGHQFTPDHNLIWPARGAGVLYRYVSLVPEDLSRLTVGRLMVGGSREPGDNVFFLKKTVFLLRIRGW